MKFIIDFNHGWNDKLLEKIGATEEHFEEYSHYVIEIESFEDLDKLIQKVDKDTNEMYSAVISFDPATIYLDDKV